MQLESGVWNWKYSPWPIRTLIPLKLRNRVTTFECECDESDSVVLGDSSLLAHISGSVTGLLKDGNPKDNKLRLCAAHLPFPTPVYFILLCLFKSRKITYSSSFSGSGCQEEFEVSDKLCCVVLWMCTRKGEMSSRGVQGVTTSDYRTSIQIRLLHRRGLGCTGRHLMWRPVTGP